MFGSSAKKKAKKAAAQSQANFYYGELSHAVAGRRAQRIDDLEVAGRDDYNAKVDQYNSRLDQVQQQLKGKSIDEAIDPIKTKYIGQIAADIEKRESNPWDNPFKKPSAMERATNIVNGKGGGGVDFGYTNISDAAAFFGTKFKLQQEIARYQGVSTSYKDAGKLKAIHEDVATLAKGLNLSNTQNKISEQIEFKNSASGQTLAAQQKAARKRGRNSTILTGTGG